MRLTAAVCDQRPGSRSCSLFYIAGRLGHRERSVEWVAGQVGDLIEHEGFPPPIVLYAGGVKVDRIGARSRWILETVDTWFDGQPAALLPPHIAESASEALAAHYAGTLDGRAAALAQGSTA